MIESPWEDNLLERKTESDLKDLLKTLVAFSNSVKPHHIATILIGEKDDGSIQGISNPDEIQKKIRRECEKIYPAIIWRSQVYEKESKSCIRVEIEYDGETPHFAGPAWVRRGSETIMATNELFQRLIDLRSNIVSEICKWLDKDVTVTGERKFPLPTSREFVSPFSGYHRWLNDQTAKIVFVNNFWVTFEKSDQTKLSEPLSELTLSYDNQNDRLKIIVNG